MAYRPKVLGDVVGVAGRMRLRSRVGDRSHITITPDYSLAVKTLYVYGLRVYAAEGRRVT